MRKSLVRNRRGFLLNWSLVFVSLRVAIAQQFFIEKHQLGVANSHVIKPFDVPEKFFLFHSPNMPKKVKIKINFLAAGNQQERPIKTAVFHSIHV